VIEFIIDFGVSHLKVWYEIFIGLVCYLS